MNWKFAQNKRTIHFLELALLIGLAAWLLTGGMALNTQAALADKVVRLHVLANSDSDEDQALKLQVRDRVLEWTTDLLKDTRERSEAEALLRGNLLEIEKVAAQEVVRQGYAYPVRVELTQAEFPTKEYEGFTLPAGEYLALRVLIGEGKGHNWWCVLFPPLCTAASTEVPDCALAAGLSGEQVDLITEADSGYVLKFKTVEWWEHLRAKWEQ